VLAHEQDLAAISETEELVNEGQLLTEIDYYFGKETSEEDDAVVVGLTKQGGPEE